MQTLSRRAALAFVICAVLVAGCSSSTPNRVDVGAASLPEPTQTPTALPFPAPTSAVRANANPTTTVENDAEVEATATSVPATPTSTPTAGEASAQDEAGGDAQSEPSVDATPEPTPTTSPTATATPTPEPTATPTATATATPQPDPTATVAPAPTAAAQPTSTPEPSVEPTATPDPDVPTATPTPTLPGGLNAVGCTIQPQRAVAVQEVLTFTAVQDPPSALVTYRFDHGDGTFDGRSVSFAIYQNPGTYNVSLEWQFGGERGTVQCGTVTVLGGTDPVDPGAFIGLERHVAVARADQRGLLVHLARVDNQNFGPPAGSRADRVVFEIDRGVVTSARLG